MPNSLQATRCNVPASSSEGAFSEACCRVCCGPPGNSCPSSCVNCLINDKTYSVLKRICGKIIKNHERQQSKEKYTLFDGGNSLNIRLQLSSCFGKSSSSIKRSSDGTSSLGGRKSRSDTDASKKKKSKKDEDSDDDKKKKKKGKKGDDEDDDGKKKKKGKGDGDGDKDGKKKKGKKGEDDEDGKDKSKKKKKKGEDDEDEKDKSKKKKKKGEGDEDEKDKSKKKGKKGEGDEDGKDKSKKKGKKGEDDEDGKDKSKKKGKKGDGDDDADKKKGKGADDKAKKTDDKAKKTDDKAKKTDDKAKKTDDKAKKTDDKAKKKAEEDALAAKKKGKDENANKGTAQNMDSCPSTIPKPARKPPRSDVNQSRCDQIRPCDILRAQMEVKEMAKCFMRTCCQNSCPRDCWCPVTCPNPSCI